MCCTLRRDRSTCRSPTLWSSAPTRSTPNPNSNPNPNPNPNPTRPRGLLHQPGRPQGPRARRPVARRPLLAVTTVKRGVSGPGHRSCSKSNSAQSQTPLNRIISQYINYFRQKNVCTALDLHLATKTQKSVATWWRHADAHLYMYVVRTSHVRLTPHESRACRRRAGVTRSPRGCHVGHTKGWDSRN